ncbi:MAG: phosphoenolpyruvate--protein phosphotransferase, partial [Gammaproteobacteria bacterium]|nr:phosphoenolpyruvate--protein phosphotransferase [Gammaproteobacteria bacterium]
MLNLLRHIVQKVNAAGDLQNTFQVLVEQTCQAMQADICSVYLVDDEQKHLSLVASQGLNKAIIGKATLTLEQGIVGQVYQKEEFINTDDASSHEAFHPLANSGEEGAKAFLGVPLIHHRQVLGVLVLQQFSRRKFTEDDISFLITLSAQLAGIIVNAENRANISEAIKSSTNAEFNVVAAIPGIAIASGWVVTAPGILEKIPDRPCSDVDAEIQTLRQALKKARQEFRDMRKNLEHDLPKQQLALFSAFEAMLSHNSLGRKIERRITRDQIWAPAALRHTIEESVQQFYELEDDYLQERAVDILDLGRRVLAHLQKHKLRKKTYTKNIILIAENLTSAMIAEVPPARLKGIISLQGSTTSHAAIVARSMGIPALMGIRDCPLDLLENRQLVLDGYGKKLLVSPSRKIIAEFRTRQAKEELFLGKISQSSGKRVHTKTKDGHKIQLLLNVSPFDTEHLENSIRVDGVGLYRTEYLFMQSKSFPGEQEQYEEYRKVLATFPNQPVVLRTLDAGGDKHLPYFPITEDNPFLGWRGIRISLDHPEIFITQLRAMLRANIDHGNLHISLPMISTLNEIDQSMELLHQVYDEVRSEEGITKKRLPFPKVGAVIEVPSAVYLIRQIVKRVDFISIGSNDLTQYLFATDRNNTRVSYLYNAFHPAILLAFSEICDAAHQAKTPVHICGEIAGNPLATILLLAMGMNAFSMNIRTIPKIRQIVRSFTYKDANKVLSKV